MIPQLLTIEEASKLLRLAKKTVYGYVCARKIPFVKIGGSVRFEEAKLAEWLKQHSVEPVKGEKK